MKEIKFAEFKEGRVYALPIEDVDSESASQIGTKAKCLIVLLPRSSFNLTLNEKENSTTS